MKEQLFKKHCTEQSDGVWELLRRMKVNVLTNRLRSVINVVRIDRLAGIESIEIVWTRVENE